MMISGLLHLMISLKIMVKEEKKMNEKLCEQILEYMKGTGDFILKEMPEVILQAIQYHWMSNLIGFILSSIFFILGISYLFYILSHIEIDKYGSWSGFTFASCWISTAISILCFGILIGSCDTLIKISYAPKYFII